MVNVTVFGSTGYAGAELVRLLRGHPYVILNSLVSKSYEGLCYSDVYGSFSHEDNLKCVSEDILEAAGHSDVIFLSMPHGIASGMITEEILENTKIIDLGADYRIKDYSVYEKWYETEHRSKKLLNEAVYGLCEINCEKIKNASLIANPGCYTTCTILALYPLLKEKLINAGGIIIDAKSGVSGAGRGLSLPIHFNECNESVKAYKLASHRHTPEIEEQLSQAYGKPLNVVFTPHLIPMNRGILSTIYSGLASGAAYEDIAEVYSSYYGNEYFIRLLKPNNYPETRWVKGSNFCDIGFTIDSRTNTLIIVSALDNLVKGAAGQAVQNMNLMYNFPENTGLTYVPIFPC